MQKYAGIGSRQTPPEVIAIMQKTAALLALDGYTCCTGACKGADQAFANGAASKGGNINLFIPWPSYEQEWIRTIPNCTVKTISPNDTDAYNSVHRFHPAASKLKQSVMKLHARNYLIVDGVDFIICWTPDGKINGGTGQALRIASEKNIPIYNLGNKKTLLKFKERIAMRT